MFKLTSSGSSLVRTGSFGSMTSLFDGLQHASVFLQAATGDAAAQGPGESGEALLDGLENAFDGKQEQFVTGDTAKVGGIVTLNLRDYKGVIPRFPGDTGPGCLLEDHFGDGSFWRVRWISTNAWGIYSTGFDAEFHLLHGSELADEWDSECFVAPGRMPSFFFCAPLALTADDRKIVHDYSSPRSRIFLPEEADMIVESHKEDKEDDNDAASKMPTTPESVPRTPG